MRQLFLVACVAKKQSKASPARDLYISPWFCRARAYAEASGAPWLVLSAEHGLLEPDSIVAPYERTLNRMRVPERKRWAGHVLCQLRPHLKDVDQVVLLGGRRYTEFLAPQIRASAVTVKQPLAHLRIGEQLRWFKEQGA